QVVVVGVDAVRLLRAEAVDGLHPDRDAELAQRLLVALELPASRPELLGIARLHALRQLVERERAARLEQRGGEVDQAFEAVSHGGISARAARRARRPRPPPGTGRGS